MMIRAYRLLFVLGGFTAFAAESLAQSVESFYQSKSLSMTISSSVGGEYDIRARLIARHIGRFIPGQPSVVPRNMVGAGGITATNWLVNVAPRDGTQLMMAVQTLATRQAIGNAAIKFDVRDFGWLGNTSASPTVVTLMRGAGVETIEAARQKEIVIAATGFDSGSYYYPAALNLFAGTKLRVVTGYPGGNEMALAMERGEVGGVGSNCLDCWRSRYPQWLAEKRLIFLVQVGLTRHPELADVPLMYEVGTSEEGRAVLRFLSADTALSRAVVTTPGVPQERLTALRSALESTLHDEAFLAEADKLDLNIVYLSGEDAKAIAASIIETPTNVIALAKQVMERKN